MANKNDNLATCLEPILQTEFVVDRSCKIPVGNDPSFVSQLQRGQSLEPRVTQSLGQCFKSGHLSSCFDEIIGFNVDSNPVPKMSKKGTDDEVSIVFLVVPLPRDCRIFDLILSINERLVTFFISLDDFWIVKAYWEVSAGPVDIVIGKKEVPIKVVSE